jgi:prolyl-tRNA editing enzyme YbaK/EbsC (Cys-tRNA(Pro) deacylase)
VLVVAAGDAMRGQPQIQGHVSDQGQQCSLLTVERLTGSAVGGVCPFALPEGTPVYLDAFAPAVFDRLSRLRQRAKQRH